MLLEVNESDGVGPGGKKDGGKEGGREGESGVMVRYLV